MKRHPHLILGAVFVAAVAVGAFQGYRIQRLREAELFYRWIQAEATQYYVFTDTTAEQGVEETGGKDRELFEQIVAVTEEKLPEVERTPDDYDVAHRPLQKIVVLARNEDRDDELWALCRGPLLAAERAEFLKYLREKKLTPVSSEFDPGAVYGQNAGVSLSNIFFGFRKVAANFVWLQVDKYWHQGYNQRMIPLMKTCVALDPSFVDAYLLGAWHMAYNMTAHMVDTPEPLKEWNPKYNLRLGEKELYYHLAIDFLKDGIRKNPRNYKLYFDLGYSIYNLKMKDYANAVKYLSEAIRHRHDRWVPRMLYISLEQNKQYKEALAGWQDHLSKLPDTADSEAPRQTAERFIARNQGMLYEQEAEAAEKRAKGAKDPAEAAAANAEAERLWGEAIKTWEKMQKIDDDPYAVGRIMRRKALKLMEEGRYLEAIALLENARWKSNSFFEEASDLIIEAKQQAGVPLSVSEKKAVIRRQEAEKYRQAQQSAGTPI